MAGEMVPLWRTGPSRMDRCGLKGKEQYLHQPQAGQQGTDHDTPSVRPGIPGSGLDEMWKM